MSDENDEVPPEAIDAGEPIEVLADLETPVASGFLGRLRNKIERRSLTSQVAVLTWEMPKAVLLELLQMVFDLFSPRDDRKGGPR